MERPNIFSVGFEGSSRAGKGTQIELLRARLDEVNIPYLVVRGDGSRPNEGRSPGDPISVWWEEVLPRLRSESADPADWNRSSYRLARELVFFRDRILPKLAMRSGVGVALLLIDRSILSRTMIPRELGLEPVADYLYPDEARTGRSIVDVDTVCPDVIFNLVASREVLLARLDPDDPKYEFRRKLIIQKCDWYKNAVDFIPEHLRSRVVQVDAAKTPQEVYEEIRLVLSGRLSSKGIDL